MASCKLSHVLLLVLGAGLGSACVAAPDADQQGPGEDGAATDDPCGPDAAGLTLPEGFCATVFADDLGGTRHLVVDGEGDVYVARRRGGGGHPGGVVALRDTDGDGRADREEPVAEVAGTGIALADGYLYYSSDTEVFRVALAEGELAPSASPETLVTGFPDQSQHAAKSFALDGAGHLYVNVGGPSNACQQEMRTAGSPGQDPCPQLEWQGGIWRFDAGTPGQTQQEDGLHYATGIRNAVALDWNAATGALYVLQHGRDSLSDLWPDLFDHQASSEQPAEEMFRVHEGDDFGWPYCYYDTVRQQKVLAPEYGGDAQQTGRCADVAGTLMAFPAHWAPNDLVFYDGDAFPAPYDGGAFIAFHGSWNRAPFPQEGYNVVFVPFADGEPAGDYEVFATGFTETETVRTPGDAAHRPTGLAVAPDGSLYVADDMRGRIWRIRPEGAR